MDFAAQCVRITSHTVQIRTYSVERSFKGVQEDDVANVGLQRWALDKAATVDEESEAANRVSGSQGKLQP